MTTKPDCLLPDNAAILERFRTNFSAQWEELLRLRRAALKTSDPDDIHDLRVASRRFRAALGLLEQLAPKESVAEAKKKVRRLTQALGGLRNIDEALLFFEARAPSDTSAGQQLYSKLSERRALELRRIERALNEFGHRQLDRMVHDMLAGLKAETILAGKKRSLQAYFSDVSISLFQPIYDLMAVSKDPEQRDSRHALRITIKKWRYFLEIVASVLECDYGILLGLLKEYQSILGQMNDVVEFGALCRNLALPASELAIVEAILSSEDELLLDKLNNLIGEKPLVYTFKVE